MNPLPFVTLALVMFGIGYTKATMRKNNVSKPRMALVGFISGVACSVAFYVYIEFFAPAELASHRGQEQENIMLAWYFGFPLLNAFYFWPFSEGE